MKVLFFISSITSIFSHLFSVDSGFVWNFHWTIIAIVGTILSLVDQYPDHRLAIHIIVTFAFPVLAVTRAFL